MVYTSKIDELLDRTVRKNGEAKKWVVIVGIAFGLIIGGGLFAVSYYATEPIVDSYLMGYSEEYILYNFYEEKADSCSVYFVGNSNLATQIYAPEIDRILENNGYTISSYNLYVSSDSPRQRLLQLDSMIQSNPSLVIYGVSYSSLINTQLAEEKTLLSNEYITMTDNLSRFYTDDELSQMLPNPYYKRGYLLRSVLPADWDFQLTHYNPDYQNYVKEPISPEWTMKKESSKDKNELYQSSLNQDNTWRPVITTEESLGKEVINYTVLKFRDANIPLIIVNLPIHPYLSEQITDETRENTFDFLNSTGVIWYDYEKLYGDEHFRDLIHGTYNGSLDFSAEMADLIIKEVESGAVHYS